MYAIFLECGHAWYIDFKVQLEISKHYALCPSCKGNVNNLAWKEIIRDVRLSDVPKQPPIFLSRGSVLRTKTIRRGNINTPFVYKRKIIK